MIRPSRVVSIGVRLSKIKEPGLDFANHKDCLPKF